MHATFAVVAERISITSGVAVDRLRPETTLKELALDSFLLVEMAVDLQEEFDAIFTQEDLHRVVTVGDLVELLNTSQAADVRARSAAGRG
ncbi:acyl carrier protein [Catellatospora sp. NPDC049609]|uniref:acyl carrier protein n=1 Tax=Catellatospora sp. NPDC049609 TaxID=3155505 RepID=UPI0034476BA9